MAPNQVLDYHCGVWANGTVGIKKEEQDRGKELQTVSRVELLCLNLPPDRENQIPLYCFQSHKTLMHNEKSTAFTIPERCNSCGDDTLDNHLLFYPITKGGYPEELYHILEISFWRSSNTKGATERIQEYFLLQNNQRG
jgi:hypothetical protein